jgi:hypothetical protein
MRQNNRAETPTCHRRREQKQRKLRSQGSAQRFRSSRAAAYNTFNLQAHLISPPSLRILRARADREWQAATVVARSKGWGW